MRRDAENSDWQNHKATQNLFVPTTQNKSVPHSVMTSPNSLKSGERGAHTIGAKGYYMMPHLGSYFHMDDLTKMQSRMGFRPGSDATNPRRPYPFADTEMPRAISGGVKSASWFRYANMDGPTESIPEGYHWDVEYYRREDGSLSTRPDLAPIPILPKGKRAQMKDYTVSTQFQLVGSGLRSSSARWSRKER